MLSANLLGTLVFAFTLSTTSLVDTHQVAALEAIAIHALDGGFGNTLLRAVFAGWLIALMVWLLPVADTGRGMVIIIITYLVSIAGFPHIIAGSSEVFYSLFTGATSPGVAIGEFFIPTLIGNIIGGVAMVAVINYAQVFSDAD